MQELTILTWIREMFSILAIIVVFWLFCLAVRSFKKFEVGEKLWVTGAICILIYVADVNHEAADLDLEFRWRFVPLALGLIAYFAYLLEPSVFRKRRLGKDPLRKKG